MRAGVRVRPHLDLLVTKLRYFAIAEQIGTILEDPGRPLAGQVDEAWRNVKQLL
jgi:hypothetical protein